MQTLHRFHVHCLQTLHTLYAHILHTTSLLSYLSAGSQPNNFPCQTSSWIKVHECLALYEVMIHDIKLSNLLSYVSAGSLPNNFPCRTSSWIKVHVLFNNFGYEYKRDIPFGLHCFHAHCVQTLHRFHVHCLQTLHTFRKHVRAWLGVRATHLMHHPVDQAKQPPAHEVYLLGLP